MLFRALKVLRQPSRINLEGRKFLTSKAAPHSQDVRPDSIEQWQVTTTFGNDLELIY